MLSWLNRILLPPHPLQPTPNREPSSLLEWPRCEGGRRSQPTPNREPSSLLEWPRCEPMEQREPSSLLECRVVTEEGEAKEEDEVNSSSRRIFSLSFFCILSNEIGTAGILAQFDGRVVAVALLGVEPEEPVEGRGEHLQGCLSVVNAAHLAQPVNRFYERCLSN